MCEGESPLPPVAKGCFKTSTVLQVTALAE